MVKSTLVMTYKVARRIAITVVGVTVLLLGVAMIVLPGPAFVVIPAGLAILSIEFAWARHWLAKVKQGAGQVFNNFNGFRKNSSKMPAEPAKKP